jgi:hypothetical protein
MARFLQPSKSTTVGHGVAMKHFNTFAKENGLNNFDSFKYKDVNEALFDQFCRYIFEATYKKDGEDVHYAVGVASQYFSGIFTNFKKKFPNHQLFVKDIHPKLNVPNWYLNMRRNFVKLLSDRIILKGDKLQTKCTAMTNEMLRRICDRLLHLNTEQDIDTEQEYEFDSGRSFRSTFGKYGA